MRYSADILHFSVSDISVKDGANLTKTDTFFECTSEFADYGAAACFRERSHTRIVAHKAMLN